MTLELRALVELVKVGITGWKAVQGAVTSSKINITEGGTPVSLAELEPHILRAEDARDAASKNAADRIDKRHGN